MSGESVSLVYVTAGSLEEARKIGRTLVEEKLAACANYWGGMESCYSWEGKIEKSEEACLLLKTRTSLVASLTERIKELHSYDVPCVCAYQVNDGNPDYMAWLLSQTKEK